MASTSETSSSISPNLIKNLNFYSTLEPERTSAIEKLIDLGEPSNTTENCDFLPKNNNFDLIDMYEDILVTPEMVQRQNSTTNEVPLNGNVFNIKEEDLKQFLDDLEAGNNDWTQHNEKRHSPSIIATDVTEKPRVLVPKTNLSNPKEDDDPEELIYEVLAQKNIEKQFLEQNKPSTAKNYKQLEKTDRVINYDEIHEHLAQLKQNGAIRKLNPPKFISGNNIATYSDVKDNDYTTKDVKPPQRQTINEINNESLKTTNLKSLDSDFIQKPKVLNADIKKILLKDENLNNKNDSFVPSTSNLNSNIFTKLSKQEFKNLINLHPNLTFNDKGVCNMKELDVLIKSYIYNISAEKPELPPDSLNEGSANNGDYTPFTNYSLKSVKKDEKLYKKKKIIVPECLKQNYTKGPSFKEKSVYLPQFMARMAIEQKLLDEELKFGKSFIRDSGTKHYFNDNFGTGITFCPNSVHMCNHLAGGSGVNDGSLTSPIVLTADCNKDRIRAQNQSQLFQKFVNGK